MKLFLQNKNPTIRFGGRLRRWMNGAALVALALSSLPGWGAESTQVKLLLSAEQSPPGETVWAGVHFTLAEGWHTYWRYSGDAGQPPQIHWELPEGVSAGEIQWPAPEKHDKEGVYSYIYSEETMLLVPLSISSAAKNLSVRARVEWLECQEEACVPREATVNATLTVNKTGRRSASAELIERWRAKVPRTDAQIALEAEWENAGEENKRSFLAFPGKEEKWALKDFYPHGYDDFDVMGETAVRQGKEGREGIRKTVFKYEQQWPKEIAGLAVVQKAGEETELVEIAFTIGGQPGEAPAAIKPPAGMFLMLWFAFFGGFILNFMPCVLPVIALKILGFVNQSQSSPGKVKRLGLLYAGGVVASFVVLAGLVIGMQWAGRPAGWGTHFQSVEFLVLMMILVALVALNFFGVFEIRLGGKTMGAAGKISGKKGYSGAFFNGVLATVLATPCTAPFLAPALGFAFAQPPAWILLFFVTIALGLAFPYVALSWNPRLLAYLPKPGPWMEKFKMAMGFPMIATAVWLYSVALSHFPPGAEAALWLGMLLVLVALSAWIWGQLVQQAAVLRPLSIGMAFLVGAGGFVWILEGELDWRARRVPAEMSGGSMVEKGIEWRTWSRAAVDEARAAGHPVLVDFTAKWCASCQINKRSSIAIDPVRKKIQAIGAVTFRADYTRKDPKIANELKRYGRAGVPLVLVFAPDEKVPAQVLPALLTPQIVLGALDRAAKNGRGMASH